MNVECIPNTMPLLRILDISDGEVIVDRTLAYDRVMGNNNNFTLHDGMKHAIIRIPTGRQGRDREFLPGLNATRIKCARPTCSTTHVCYAMR